jgi:hypothetical protein
MQMTSLLFLSTAGLLVACGGAQPAPSDPIDGGPDAAPPPEITATATPDTVTAGESFTIAVEVEGLEVVNPTTPTGAGPGKGHFHYQLDTWDDYTAGWTPTVSIATTGDTPPGEHTVRLWLVDGFHTDIRPRVETTVTVTVEAAP